MQPELVRDASGTTTEVLWQHIEALKTAIDALIAETEAYFPIAGDAHNCEREKTLQRVEGAADR